MQSELAAVVFVHARGVGGLYDHPDETDSIDSY